MAEQPKKQAKLDTEKEKQAERVRQKEAAAKPAEAPKKEAIEKKKQREINETQARLDQAKGEVEAGKEVNEVQTENDAPAEDKEGEESTDKPQGAYESVTKTLSDTWQSVTGFFKGGSEKLTIGGMFKMVGNTIDILRNQIAEHLGPMLAEYEKIDQGGMLSNLLSINTLLAPLKLFVGAERFTMYRVLKEKGIMLVQSPVPGVEISTQSYGDLLAYYKEKVLPINSTVTFAMFMEEAVKNLDTVPAVPAEGTPLQPITMDMLIAAAKKITVQPAATPAPSTVAPAATPAPNSAVPAVAAATAVIATPAAAPTVTPEIQLSNDITALLATPKSIAPNTPQKLGNHTITFNEAASLISIDGINYKLMVDGSHMNIGNIHIADGVLKINVSWGIFGEEATLNAETITKILSSPSTYSEPHTKDGTTRQVSLEKNI